MPMVAKLPRIYSKGEGSSGPEVTGAGRPSCHSIIFFSDSFGQPPPPWSSFPVNPLMYPNYILPYFRTRHIPRLSPTIPFTAPLQTALCPNQVQRLERPSAGHRFEKLWPRPVFPTRKNAESAQMYLRCSIVHAIHANNCVHTAPLACTLPNCKRTKGKGANSQFAHFAEAMRVRRGSSHSYFVQRKSLLAFRIHRFGRSKGDCVNDILS
ncbi:hypothetical protein BJ322DRAFT_478333 [Thelephora terrestris]|uniref:Uncharacterized protein n=1 Tax=Thelephora terrestris TaxID=56493 RepID=A0A9P6H3U5_9AGAM|nr:hypothetical protein BJ322DRAFT_478333 [Thelephora terrestris]